MKINEIIKERRMLQGLTQEQMANRLGVSAPAVNKGEKGSSYPDITILPPLARLLKVDLNTLLSFSEDLTDQDIARCVNEIAEAMYSEGFRTGYEKIIDKIHEYPTCDKLIVNLAVFLDGAITMFQAEDPEYYKRQAESLYERVSGSEDLEVKYQAISMLVRKHMARMEYEKAQKLLDQLPEIVYDKQRQQGELYIRSGETDKASALFEHKLMTSATEIQSILITVIEIALKDERIEDAFYYAGIVEKMTTLFDLWEYNTHATYFQLYAAQKDKENSIRVLKELLSSMQSYWDISGSKLYRHIKTKTNEEESQQRIGGIFIDLLKKDPDNDLEFLKDDPEFQKLMEEYSG